VKTAQELRSGNVFLIEGSPFVVLKSEFTKSGRGASVVNLKYKQLRGNAVKQEVYKADVKFEDIVLDRKACNYSYFGDPMYVFMDTEYNQYEMGREDVADAVNYLVEGQTCELVFFEDTPIAVELPVLVALDIEYTEPAVRGDTSGKVLKIARLVTGHEIQVPAFCNTGDKIQVDTRTGEYRNRA
jgi:elongation factor P